MSLLQRGYVPKALNGLNHPALLILQIGDALGNRKVFTGFILDINFFIFHLMCQRIIKIQSTFCTLMFSSNPLINTGKADHLFCGIACNPLSCQIPLCYFFVTVNGENCCG